MILQRVIYHNQYTSAAMENQMKTVSPGPDVLELDKCELAGGGGVNDTYCEDAATENQPFTPWSRMVARHALTNFSLILCENFFCELV